MSIAEMFQCFKGHVMFSFHHADPDLDILFEKLRAQTRR